MINTCQYLKCRKDFKTEKKNKKFCSNNCYLEDRKENSANYLNGAFKKGSSPWNFGKKFTKIGDTMIRKKTLVSGNKKNLRFVNIGDGNGGIKYVRNDRFVWEQVNGPLPSGHSIFHKDGRTLNDDINNLECVTFSEALSRYSALRDSVFDLKNKNHVKKIVAGCLRGDRKIQKMLFEMFYDSVMITAMTFTKDEDTAKDIVNDSFIKAFKKIDTFQLEHSLEGWIKKIVINTAIDYTRKSKSTFSVDIEEGGFDKKLSIEDKEFELEELNEARGISGGDILKMIQELPDGYRTTFSLFVMHGLSHEEIAQKMGVVEGTSKSNYSKARAILQDKIREFIKNKKVIDEKTIQKKMEICKEYDLELAYA